MALRCWARGIFGLLLTGLGSTAATAQTTPAEPVASDPQTAAAPAVLNYKAQLTATLAAGQVTRTLLNSAAAVSYAKGRHFGFPLAGSFIYGKQDGRLREREVLVSLTPYYRLGRFRAYGIGTYERSNLRAILNRVQVGAGPGWAFYRNDSLGRELVISNLLLREVTHFTEGTDRRVTRSSLRVKFTHGWKLLSFSAITLYQPTFGNKNDYRFSENAALNLKVNNRLALSVVYSYAYEQRVVEAKARGNTNLTLGLSYSNSR